MIPKKGANPFFGRFKGDSKGGNPESPLWELLLESKNLFFAPEEKVLEPSLSTRIPFHPSRKENL